MGTSYTRNSSHATQGKTSCLEMPCFLIGADGKAWFEKCVELLNHLLQQQLSQNIYPVGLKWRSAPGLTAGCTHLKALASTISDLLMLGAPVSRLSTKVPRILVRPFIAFKTSIPTWAQNHCVLKKFGERNSRVQTSEVISQAERQIPWPQRPQRSQQPQLQEVKRATGIQWICM